MKFPIALIGIVVSFAFFVLAVYLVISADRTNFSWQMPSALLIMWTAHYLLLVLKEWTGDAPINNGER